MFANATFLRYWVLLNCWLNCIISKITILGTSISSELIGLYAFGIYINKVAYQRSELYQKKFNSQNFKKISFSKMLPNSTKECTRLYSTQKVVIDSMYFQKSKIKTPLKYTLEKSIHFD